MYLNKILFHVEFKKDLNKFGLLRWTCDDLTNEITYLDLVIRLDNGEFKFRTWSSSFENSPSGLLGGLFKKKMRKLRSKADRKINDKLFG